MTTTETAIKTGDTVRHIPSGETWVVAYVRPETNDLAWLGWPEGLARLSDCELVKSCSEEESLRWLRDMAKSKGARQHHAERELKRRGLA